MFTPKIYNICAKIYNAYIKIYNVCTKIYNIYTEIYNVYNKIYKVYLTNAFMLCILSSVYHWSSQITSLLLSKYSKLLLW
jgi:hypothetical protein